MKEQADSDRDVHFVNVIWLVLLYYLRVVTAIKWSRVTESDLSLFAVICKEI